MCQSLRIQKASKRNPPPRGFVLGVLEGVERYEQPNNLSEELRLQQFELDSPPNFHIDVDIPQECIHSATATPQAHCPFFYSAAIRIVEGTLYKVCSVSQPHCIFHTCLSQAFHTLGTHDPSTKMFHHLSCGGCLISGAQTKSRSEVFSPGISSHDVCSQEASLHLMKADNTLPHHWRIHQSRRHQ